MFISLKPGTKDVESENERENVRMDVK
jgi:hypothetical protein